MKCPLCQLCSSLKDKEYENDAELAQHCSRDHTPLALAYSFIDNYFALKGLIEDIKQRIENGLEFRDGVLDKSERRCTDEKLKILCSILKDYQNVKV